MNPAAMTFTVDWLSFTGYRCNIFFKVLGAENGSDKFYLQQVLEN